MAKYKDIMKNLDATESSVKEREARWEEAKLSYVAIKESLENAKLKGINIYDLEQHLTAYMPAFDMGNYKECMRIIQDIQSIVDKRIAEYESASMNLNIVKDSNNSNPTKNINEKSLDRGPERMPKYAWVKYSLILCLVGAILGGCIGYFLGDLFGKQIMARIMAGFWGIDVEMYQQNDQFLLAYRGAGVLIFGFIGLVWGWDYPKQKQRQKGKALYEKRKEERNRNSEEILIGGRLVRKS